MSTDTALGVLLEQLADANPHRPAITCGEETVSRAALETRTNRLARVYRDLGVAQDSFVTIGLPNGIGFFEAVRAAAHPPPQCAMGRLARPRPA
jgi:bile acid-coenzyme A ligase